MTAPPLRVLLVEDNPDDARLLLRELQRAGFDPVAARVETEAAFLAALDPALDVILCDYNLPQFDAMRALPLSRERLPDVPFLIVSGSIGEETAVEAMKRGATDYLLKDRLSRLGPAVRQALAERELRNAERRAQVALRASEAQYRVLADSIPQIVWTAGPDGALDYLNQRAAEYTGLAVHGLTGWSWEQVIHPDDLPDVMEQWLGTIRTGTPRENEFRLRRADGAYRWHINRQVALRDAAGAVAHWFGTCTDIHDQRAATEQLARDALLLASVRDSVVVTDLAGVVTYWNDGATRLFGWTAEETIGRPYADRFPEPIRAWVAAEIADRTAGGEWHAEYEDYRKDGSRVWIDAHVTRIADAAGRPAGVMGIAHDITARKRDEEELRFQHALLRCQTDASPDGILVVGPDGRILSHNRRFLDKLGIPAELVAAGDDAPVLARIRDLTADPDAFATRVAAIYADPDTQSHDEVALADGRTLDRYSGPIRAAGRELLGRVWYFRDITARKRAEAERDAALARLRLQIERMPLAYLLSGPDFRYTAWNPAAERIFGFAAAEALGKHPFDVIVPVASRPLVADVFARLAAGDMDAHGECENVTRDGRAITCEWYNTPLLDAAGTFVGLLSLAQDVTARKRLEAQFLQAQKMEAFGQLAGGVAHDFNNLLTVINGYGDLLLATLPPAAPERDHVGAIREAGERAAALTAQLLAFSRKTIVEPKVLDLNAVVEAIAKMLRRLIGEDVRLVLALSPTLSRVRADLGQFEQVVMNLAVNARDAMPTGGRLTVETADADRPAEAPDLPPGRYVRLTVTDTGGGMSDEVKAKIFEPFFTTKGVGKGTGLGLATVYGIVAQAGGHVVVDSAVGRGTAFAIYLPAVADAPAGRGAAGDAPSARGAETVLLVEDEEAVRSLVRLTLRRQGYTVLEAGGGAEAGRMADAHPGPIHLLLADVVMPGMGGRELADRLRARRADLRVLYMSGYTDDAVVRYGVTEVTGAFLQKPFTPVALARKVRAVLDAPANPPA